MQYDEILENIHKDISKMEYPGCPHCGSKEGLVGDHIIPKSKGGSDDAANREEMCSRCNAAKGTDSRDEFLQWINKLVAYQKNKKRG